MNHLRKRLLAMHIAYIGKAPQPIRSDTKPMPLFQHFDSEEARQEYLRDVARDQKNGTVPF